MIYDFMRLIVLFDLPMITKKDVRAYNVFRKYLIKNGYIMMQFSVYCRIFNNRESASKHLEVLKRNVPKKGQIRVMTVTEKQYSNIDIIVGGVSRQEKVINEEPYLNI